MEAQHRLKTVRKKLGLTQESLAKSIGLNRGKITSLELGVVKISTLHAIALEYIHGINRNWLLNGDEPIFQKNSIDKPISDAQLDQALQILHEALEETEVEINEKQKQACLEIIREELGKSNSKIKDDIKKYLKAFGE